MSAEREAALAAVREVFAGRDADWDWELACKRSVGASLARRRHEPVQSERWSEQAIAVRIRCADGRSALAAAAGWRNAGAAALAALADAGRQSLPCARGADFAEAWPGEPAGGGTTDR